MIRWRSQLNPVKSAQKIQHSLVQLLCLNLADELGVSHHEASYIIGRKCAALKWDVHAYRV